MSTSTGKEPAMRTRRAVVLDEFGPPSVMSWRTEPVPARGDDEVVVAVEAIGVNFADTIVRRGEYRRDQPLTFTPGFEVAGTVLEGPADGPPTGTRVAVFCENGGGYADVVVAPRDHVFTIAPDVATEDAAALFTQGVTAWYAVHRYGRLRPGETIAVHAASGGLGGLCIQLAVAHGATAIGTASTAAKRERARAHGAAHVLSSDPETLTEGLREVTGGRGPDVIVDGVGGEVFQPSLRALAFNGRYVVAGSASQQPAMLDARGLMPRGQTIAGFVVARVAEDDPAEPQATFDEVQRLFADGRLTPAVQLLGADEAARAHELIEGRTLTGKVVLRFDR